MTALKTTFSGLTAALNRAVNQLDLSKAVTERAAKIVDDDSSVVMTGPNTAVVSTSALQTREEV